MSVTSDLHYAVVLRDGRCCLAFLGDPRHVCRDQWGDPHAPTALHKLTVEHVREHPGGRRRDEYGWLVAMCATGNVNHEGSTTETRQRINDYLRGIRAQEERGR